MAGMASFVNPHDISFSSFGWAESSGSALQTTRSRRSGGTVPVGLLRRSSGLPGSVPKIWPQALIDQPSDVGYRRLYYYLHKLVDRAIGRILEALDRQGWPMTRSSSSPLTTATSWERTAA